MNTARTVYFGPSSSDYATVGSVDSGEDIVVMGKNAGWYFISYVVGSTSTFKSGYVRSQLYQIFQVLLMKLIFQADIIIRILN